MKIILDEIGVKEILSNHAFDTFGKLLGVEKKEDIKLKLDISYSTIREMVISKVENTGDDKDDQ